MLQKKEKMPRICQVLAAQTWPLFQTGAVKSKHINGILKRSEDS